jgi:hypothetical protein
MRIGSSGQALFEFIYFSVFSAIFVGVAGSILRTEWNRSKCAFLVFESAHSFLMSRDSGMTVTEINRSHLIKPSPSLHVADVKDFENQIIASGHCGVHFEEVKLFKLEFIKW